VAAEQFLQYPSYTLSYRFCADAPQSQALQAELYISLPGCLMYQLASNPLPQHPAQ
jgi:hypothetical protein